MNYKYRLILFSLLIGTAILVTGIFLDVTVPTAASDQPSTDISLGVDPSQKTVVRLYYESQEQLNAVAGELDIWEIHQLPGIGPNSGYALAAVYPAQQDWLESLGYRVEMDQEHTDLLKSPSASLDPRYYYFDNYVTNPNDLYMVDFLVETAAISPTITQLFDLGDAWQSLHMGHHRDMWVLRITSEDPIYGAISDKPPFFLFANVHAREVTTPEMAIRYIKYLTTGYNDMGGYGKDPDVTWLVNHHVVYVLVSQNPDGRVPNEQNIDNYRRKNMDSDDGCIDPNSWGVDLNRNSSFKWGCCGGSSGSPCSELYRGPIKGSEPETQAFQTYFASVFLDQNGNNGDDVIPPAAPNEATGIFISLHTYGDYVLWPWGFGGDAPNGQQLQTIGRKLAFLNGLNPLKFLYTVDGATDDWTYGKFGVASFTYEIGDDYGSCGDFFPEYGCQDGIDGMPRNFWAEMKPSFIYANKIARTPYITAYGPDSTDLLTNPASVPVGIPVSLTGTVADSRYGNDPLHNVYAAEYFIDSEGEDGTGIALSPMDGTWGEVTEDIITEVDTADLAVGRHYILVHGKTTINSTDYWGPFTAIFVEITEPIAPFAEFTSNSPVQLDQTTIFTNTTIGSEPMTYAWDFGDNVGVSSDKDPIYLYGTLGTYTVTLVVDNPYGSDTFTDTVTIVPVAIRSADIIKITNDPILPGDVVDFSVDLLPDNAGKPYNYTINFGDGTNITDSSSADPLLISHTFLSSSWYTVQISINNAGMIDPVVDEVDVKVLFRNFLSITVR